MWDVAKLSLGSTVAVISLTWVLGGIVLIAASTLALLECAINKSHREDWPTKLGMFVAGIISAPAGWFVGNFAVGIVKEAIRSLSS